MEVSEQDILKINKGRTRIRVKQSVGAATLLIVLINLYFVDGAIVAHLIHILAKHDTAMNARRTVLGRVPATLRTRVMMTRSILVLLNAEAIVKPPIRSIIVGENITENIHLGKYQPKGIDKWFNAHLVASGLVRRVVLPSGAAGERMARSVTSSRGTRRDVTNSGIALK